MNHSDAGTSSESKGKSRILSLRSRQEKAKNAGSPPVIKIQYCKFIYVLHIKTETYLESPQCWDSSKRSVKK